MSKRKNHGIDFEAPASPPEASAGPEPPFPSTEWVEWRAGALERASSVVNADARKALARTLAELLARHRVLTERELRGELKAEVGRTLPAVARQIRDLARELGITEKVKKKSAVGGVF